MKPARFTVLLIVLSGVCVCAMMHAKRVTADDTRPTATAVPEPRAKNGKKLLTAMDLMKVVNVGSPRISPDGNRVVYTATETKTEKDKEWKTSTQIWVAPTGQGQTRQYTRGEKNAGSPEWSPDGSMLAFLTDREKDGERQVWMMPADGGEAWSVTSHKGGISAFHFSPDGKQLVFVATDQPAKDEEERKKVKDDTVLIDRDLKMAHLWLFNLEKKEEKRITEGDFTVSDPQWAPDSSRITYTVRPTPKADDGGLSDVWVLSIASGEKKKIEDTPASSDSARWSPDGKWIAYTGSTDPNGGVSTSYLYLVGANGGSPKQLTSNFNLDAGTPVWSRDGKSIYFNSNVLEANEIFSTDVATGATTQLSKSGTSINVAEISKDGNTVVGTLTLSTAPAEVYKSNLKFMQPVALTSHNRWLSDYTVAETEIVKWKSKDGMEIEGLLTKPVDTDGNKVPLLLNPHGGPTGASVKTFN